MLYIQKDLTSIVIPSRNEKYLQKTIQDLLTNARGSIEILAVLDGYWPEVGEIVLDARVHYLHIPVAQGMRNAINKAVAVARGEYILKTDAHCMFDVGYDTTLRHDIGADWVIVPRRFRLDVDKWEIIKDGRPPIDYMTLGPDLKGYEDRAKNELSAKKELGGIDDLMTSQGSCWFMKREYYDYLELLDEKTYGPFYKEMQEIGLKCWLSGGRMVVNKNTWYAHWHKPKSVGRGYKLDKTADEIANKAMLGWKTDMKFWHKTKYPLPWLFEKFNIKFDYELKI
jgi:glycosyltransferase involved in cell wall biosynthesis